MQSSSVCCSGPKVFNRALRGYSTRMTESRPSLRQAPRSAVRTFQTFAAPTPMSGSVNLSINGRFWQRAQTSQPNAATSPVPNARNCRAFLAILREEPFAEQAVDLPKGPEPRTAPSPFSRNRSLVFKHPSLSYLEFSLPSQNDQAREFRSTISPLP